MQGVGWGAAAPYLDLAIINLLAKLGRKQSMKYSGTKHAVMPFATAEISEICTIPSVAV